MRSRLRAELEAAYEEDLDEVFDVAAVRAALEQRLRSLESELHQVCAAGLLAALPDQAGGAGPTPHPSRAARWRDAHVGSPPARGGCAYA